MGCWEKLYYLGLTTAVMLQVVYNLGGDLELGGKYLDLRSLAYSIGSLIPAIALGIHAMKLTSKTDSAELVAAANSFMHKLICYFYVAIIACLALWTAYAHLRQFHQLGPEKVVSYQRSVRWQIYIWYVLQYTPTWILTFSYLHKVNQINKSATKVKSQSTYDSLTTKPSNTEQMPPLDENTRAAFNAPIV